MSYKVLMVGRNRSFIRGLERADPRTEVYILEEAALRRRWTSKPFTSPIIKASRATSYQQASTVVETAMRWHEAIGFDVVVPGVEYAVVGASAVARALGCRYLGDRAACHLTNKLRLRELCEAAGMPQPRYGEITSAADVHAFFRGEPLVVKPANRQASSGVVRVDARTDVERAYAAMAAAQDVQVVNPRMSCQYMVEEFVPGVEVSVETLVKDGRPLFHNVTGKTTTEGPYFVEMGHVVPAPLEPEQLRDLRAQQDRLVAALAARDGFLHAEWKLTAAGPRLIECAGRVAGDSILDLIELAYGLNVYMAIVRTLAGEPIPIPQAPVQGASIRFFDPPPGTLRRIEGLEALENGDPHVAEWSITLKEGDQVPPLESSWSRVGYVITSGSDALDAQRRAEAVRDRIRFVVGDRAPASTVGVG
jgi:biotin carboxylase